MYIYRHVYITCYKKKSVRGYPKIGLDLNRLEPTGSVGQWVSSIMHSTIYILAIISGQI